MNISTIPLKNLSNEINELFKNTERFLKQKNKTTEELKFEEYPIGDKGLSLCENELIHLDLNKPDTLSLFKKEDGSFLILRQDKNDCYTHTLADFHPTDKSADTVYVMGDKKNAELILKEIKDANNQVKELLKETVTKQSKIKKAAKPRR